MPVFPSRSVQRCRNSDVHESLTHVSQQVKSDKSLPTQDQDVTNDKRLTTRGSVLHALGKIKRRKTLPIRAKKLQKTLRRVFTKSCLRGMTDNSDENSVMLALTTPGQVGSLVDASFSL